MDFIRTIKPSRDVPAFFHLTPIVDSLGKPSILSKDNETYQPIKLEDYFQQNKQIEIEIGCGKGTFMENYCRQFPDKSFMGIEKEPSIAYIAAKKNQKNPQPHCCILHGDAFYFLRDYLKPNTIKAFHMYFPDPWPKKKHFKRRLLHLNYLEQVKRVASDGSIFYWRTDHQEYHQRSMDTFLKLDWITPLEGVQKYQEIKTSFEIKYIQENRPIYRFSFKINKS